MEAGNRILTITNDIIQKQQNDDATYPIPTTNEPTRTMNS